MNAELVAAKQKQSCKDVGIQELLSVFARISILEDIAVCNLRKE